MNDDRTDLEVFQQCRDLVFGDWTSAAIFVPLRVWIGEKLLHHLLRCYLRAVLGKHRPQCREELNSHAGLVWSARKVYGSTTCLLRPTTTCMLRNLQRQFPIGTQPIVKTGQLRRLQFLDDTDVVGSPPRAVKDQVLCQHFEGVAALPVPTALSSIVTAAPISP
jgi:hypothetical protein